MQTVKHYLWSWIAGAFLMGMITNAAAQENQGYNIQCATPEMEKGWQRLAENNIFFGHQSVGENILEGLTLLAQKCAKKVPVLELREAQTLPFSEAAIIHSKIGENRQPETKIADFAGLLDKGVGRPVDIAFMKFCYIDFQVDTDVEQLFTRYQDTLNGLTERHPDVLFLSFSVPLRSLKTGIKAWVKNALEGRFSGVYGMWENKKRHEFNQRLRAQYADNHKLFDIAAIESTLPDGTREKYSLEGKQYYSLYQGYTYDGGHLNQQGQLHVAQAFVHFLGQLQL